jgi:hypothetical protein
VVAAPTLVGIGSLAPATWPLLRAPLLVPGLIVAVLPLVSLEGARWRRGPRAVAFAAVAAAATVEPSSLLAGALPLGLAVLGSLAVLPDRAADRTTLGTTLGATVLAFGALLFAHVHLELPPARATLGAMAPALATLLLVVVAAAASARAHVRAPFGL